VAEWVYARSFAKIYPNFSIRISNAEMTKKLLKKQFFVRINPDKIYDFRQPKGQNTLLRILG
jgi:hypothetical protein